MKAEYMALTEATKELVWMWGFLKELVHESNNPTNLFTDNQSMLTCLRIQFYMSGWNILTYITTSFAMQFRTTWYGYSTFLQKIWWQTASLRLWAMKNIGGAQHAWECVDALSVGVMYVWGPLWSLLFIAWDIGRHNRLGQEITYSGTCFGIIIIWIVRKAASGSVEENATLWV